MGAWTRSMVNQGNSLLACNLYSRASHCRGPSCSRCVCMAVQVATGCARWSASKRVQVMPLCIREFFKEPSC